MSSSNEFFKSTYHFQWKLLKNGNEKEKLDVQLRTRIIHPLLYQLHGGRVTWVNVLRSEWFLIYPADIEFYLTSS